MGANWLLGRETLQSAVGSENGGKFDHIVKNCAIFQKPLAENLVFGVTLTGLPGELRVDILQVLGQILSYVVSHVVMTDRYTCMSYPV